MSDRRFTRWHRAIADDWYLPGALALTGLLLAGLMVRIDLAVRLDPPEDMLWLYGGDASGASAMLTAIASSAITVAGVIFSANFVALQLASSLYTPRVIHTLVRRRWLQIVLGTFLASFIYSLIVLRAVRGGSDESDEFVPVLSVSVALLLALASVGVIIFYIHRAAHMINPNSVIRSAAAESFLILRQLPPVGSTPAGAAMPESPPSAEPAAQVTAPRNGYIQQIDGDALYALASRGLATIRLERLVGEFVMRGELIASVQPSTSCDAEAEAVIQRAFMIGSERTPEQDVEFGIRRVADIALKALSPAINDPTTAMTCVDVLSSLLVEVAERPVAPLGVSGSPTHGGETLRILWDDRLFERCLEVGFVQIHHYGAGDALFMSYVLTSLRRVAALVHERHRPALIREAENVRASALDTIRLPNDRARIEQAARWLDVERSPALA
jgi:uncharacterized membrane protein